MTRSLVMLLLGSALLLSSCSNNANNVVLADLNRSEKIQLFCAEVEELEGNLSLVQELLPSVLCTSDTTFNSEVDARVLGAVTQVQTGEVAVIDFTRSRIANTNVTVPGVTPVTVGEQPTAIQISPFESTYSYITSFSPKSLQAVSSVELLTGDRALPRQEVRFDAGPKDVALHESADVCVDRDEEQRVTGAESMVRYRYLYVAIPDLGQIAQVPVDFDEATGAQTFGDPTFLTLGTYGCDDVTQGDPPTSDETDYHRMCPENAPELMREGRFIKEVSTTTPCVQGDSVGPKPVALMVDRGAEQGISFPFDTPGDGDDPDNPCDDTDRDRFHSGSDEDDVLLVADANQPVIHRFQIDENGATPLEPIVTATPTTDLDATPLVPKSSDSTDVAATQRYIYAVSASDGSVLALEYTPGDPDFGQVLPVIPGLSARANEETVESRNRVRFEFSNVRSIEVVSPSYELIPDGAGLQVPDIAICDPNVDGEFSSPTNAANMRGVFLAVSLSNGTMFFLDVYDLNAPCRGGSGNLACTVAETGSDRFASIRRHRRRFSFAPSTYVTVDGTPSLQFNAANGRIDELTGEAVGSDGPGLVLVECPPSMLLPEDPNRAAFGARPGGDGVGLICASSQAWSSFSQRWDARWQGLIPNSEGGLGLFADTNIQGDESGNWFQAGDVPFCRVGVLGRQSGSDPNAGPMNTYVGDRLVITGELPPETRNTTACDEFVDLKEDIDERQIWFPILEAYDDQLKIGAAPEGARYTLDEVRACYTQFTEYQIHTQEAYTVIGTETGFVHRVVADPSNDDRCVPDATRPIVADDVDTFLTGRAFPDVQFTNPLVSFQIGAFPVGTTPTDSTVALLSFNVSNLFTSLAVSSADGIRSLPASMLFSPEQDQLFFVDYEVGVRRITFSPLNFAQDFN